MGQVKNKNAIAAYHMHSAPIEQLTWIFHTDRAWSDTDSITFYIGGVPCAIFWDDKIELSENVILNKEQWAKIGNVLEGCQ